MKEKSVKVLPFNNFSIEQILLISILGNKGGVTLLNPINCDDGVAVCTRFKNIDSSTVPISAECRIEIQVILGFVIIQIGLNIFL